MTKESILIKQLRDNFTKLNTIKNITNDIEENGLIFFNEAKDIFKKLKEIQTSYSKQMVLSPTLSSGIKPHQTKNLKNSNSLNHFNSKTNYSFFNIKNNDINNIKFLAVLRNLYNFFMLQHKIYCYNIFFLCYSNIILMLDFMLVLKVIYML